MEKICVYVCVDVSTFTFLFSSVCVFTHVNEKQKMDDFSPYKKLGFSFSSLSSFD